MHENSVILGSFRAASAAMAVRARIDRAVAARVGTMYRHWTKIAPLTAEHHFLKPHPSRPAGEAIVAVVAAG